MKEKSQAEIFEFVEKIKARDNERNLHIGDRMVVVTTDNDGFQLMHEGDYFRERGRVYKVNIEKIY